MFSQRGKTMSFHGRELSPVPAIIRRPKTMPELLSAARMKFSADVTVIRPKLTKVLLNVMVQGGVGVVQVLISLELTVKDLISATLKQYVKEGRRPVIDSSGVDEFDLHYSQFSLESLDREEKLSVLGSRNFFLCKTRKVVEDSGDSSSITADSCSKQAEKATKLVSPLPPWLKFMSFMF